MVQNLFTFWQNSAISETFFKVNFYENYTSNEAQTKLEPLLKAKICFFEAFKKNSKMDQNRQKVNLKPN